MKVSRVSEMRGLDQRAIEEFGIVPEISMENVGQAVYFALLRAFGVEGRRFVVFFGLGNNGGDGFVVARKIHSSGGTVKVFVLGDPSRLKGAARVNLDPACAPGWAAAHRLSKSSIESSTFEHHQPLSNAPNQGKIFM